MDARTVIRVLKTPVTLILLVVFGRRIVESLQTSGMK